MAAWPKYEEAGNDYRPIAANLAGVSVIASTLFFFILNLFDLIRMYLAALNASLQWYAATQHTIQSVRRGLISKYM